jgi:FkbM family methyltransferase
VFHRDPPFISYAQNFEDVMLWRVLRYLPSGYYIDVGANDPADTSVTRAFYERGWRGINIEPVKEYYDRLCAERQEDINLQLAVGASRGEIDFFEVPETGLSTADPEVMRQYEAEGLGLKKYRVKVTTLADICKEYVDGEVHFLKIDVEGFEGQVLKGMDFEQYRPWILVIESPFEGEPEWQKDVLAAGYEFVYFDGLNGFYLAREHNHFRTAFRIPPGNLDNFQLCYGHRLSFPVGQLKQDLEAAVNRADRVENRFYGLCPPRIMRLLSRIKRALKFQFARNP